jgi:hypothetical protein
MTGGWRKLHNEELHNLYSSPNVIKMIKSKKMKWEGHVTHMAGNPKGKRPFRTPRCRLEDNIKIYLGEILLESVDWIHLAYYGDCWRAVMNTIINHQVP